MARTLFVFPLFLALLLVAPATASAGDAGENAETPSITEAMPDPPPPEPDFGEDPFGEEDRSASIADPLEPLNRVFFFINDKTYFWILKPVARGYRAILPRDIRVCVKNFFSNLAMPVRLVNNLLQGKVRNSGVVLLRFAINTTMGIGGLSDTAKDYYHIEPREEDLGQTLGKYGLGHGFYIVIPLVGPSSLRDAAGLTGDLFLYPTTYTNDAKLTLASYALFMVNRVSLSIGEYEDLKKSAVDPYVAVRDGYSQYRAKKLGE